MDNNATDKTGAGDTPVTPELVEITLDNKKVMVTKASADILEQRAHDLGSRNDKLLQEGREKLDAEKADITDKLEQDKINLDKIIADGGKDLSKYHSLVNGGDGKYYGVLPGAPDEPVASNIPDATPPTTSAFDESKITELAGKVIELEKTMKTAAEVTRKTKVNAVVEIAEKMSARFPNSIAYLDAIIATDMDNFDTVNGRPPSEDDIEKMFQARHKLMGANTTTNTNPTGGLPDIRGGGAPTPPDRKRPSLDDTEGVAKYMQESAALSQR